MKNLAHIFCSLCVLLSLAISLPAQSQPESSTLVVESQDGSKKHELKVGAGLNYQVKGGKMQRKGHIESVQDSSMTVAGKEIAFSDLDVVVHIRGKRKPLGAGLAIGSLIAEPFSLLLWVVSLLFLLDNPSAAQRVIIGILTALTLFIFPLLIILGVILLAIGSKRFDLRGKWRLRKG